MFWLQRHGGFGRALLGGLLVPSCNCCPLLALLGGLPGPSQGASCLPSWFALLGASWGASWGPPGGPPGSSVQFGGFDLRRQERNGGLARLHPPGEVVFQLHASDHQASSLFTDMLLAHFPCD